MSDLDLGHWMLADGLEFKPDAFGFIYLITGITEQCNLKYIGKKQMLSKRKLKPLKGKTRKRTQIKESDWRDYISSSNVLVDAIKKYGKAAFEFRILKWTSCKWESAYEELVEQINRNVIWDPTYVNGILNVRLAAPPNHLIEARKLKETK